MDVDPRRLISGDYASRLHAIGELTRADLDHPEVLRAAFTACADATCPPDWDLRPPVEEMEDDPSVGAILRGHLLRIGIPGGAETERGLLNLVEKDPNFVAYALGRTSWNDEVGAVRRMAGPLLRAGVSLSASFYGLADAGRRALCECCAASPDAGAESLESIAWSPEGAPFVASLRSLDPLLTPAYELAARHPAARPGALAALREISRRGDRRAMGCVALHDEAAIPAFREWLLGKPLVQEFRSWWLDALRARPERPADFPLILLLEAACGDQLLADLREFVPPWTPDVRDYLAAHAGQCMNGLRLAMRAGVAPPEAVERLVEHLASGRADERDFQDSVQALREVGAPGEHCFDLALRRPERLALLVEALPRDRARLHVFVIRYVEICEAAPLVLETHSAEPHGHGFYRMRKGCAPHALAPLLDALGDEDLRRRAEAVYPKFVREYAK